MALKRKIKKRRGRREGEKERLAREREREGSTKTRSPERGKIKICPRRYIIRPTTFVRPRNLHVKRGPATSNLWFFFLAFLSFSLSLPCLFFFSIHPALKDEKFTTSATTSRLVFSRKIPWFRPFSTFFPRISSFFPFFFSPFPSLSSLQSSTVHGKRPCRALTRGRRNLLEANYSRPPLFRRVYRWNKFEKEGWSRGEFCWLTEETGLVCFTCNGDKVVMAIIIGFFFSFFLGNFTRWITRVEQIIAILFYSD